jgi:surfeit locus 1 family protein
MNTTANTQQLSWDTDWRITVFVVLFVPLFIGLGFWQQGRALEKQAIAASWAERQQESPVPLLSLAANPDELAYRRVLLRGHFVQGRDFLLDNRIYKGRYGVEVVSPLQLEDSEIVVLVNRGWVEADAGRRSLPDIPSETELQVLQGLVYVPPGDAYILGQISDNEDWPRMIQALEMPSLAAMLETRLFPYTVRLDANSVAGFTIDWPLVNISPEKHRAYAVQWFAMAVALLLIYLWRSTNLHVLWRQRKEEQV